MTKAAANPINTTNHQPNPNMRNHKRAAQDRSRSQVLSTLWVGVMWIFLVVANLVAATYLTTLNPDFVLKLTSVLGVIFGSISAVSAVVILYYKRNSAIKRKLRRSEPVTAVALENKIARRSHELELLQELQAEVNFLRKEKPDFTEQDIRSMLLKLRQEEKLSESAYQFALRFFTAPPFRTRMSSNSENEVPRDTGPQSLSGVRS